MTTQPSPAPARRPDPRRTVSEAKIATLVGSVAGFGAVMGLVLLDPVGSATATSATVQAQPVSHAAPAAPQQPAQTPASDFFSPPPGFTDQPAIVGQGAGGGSQGFSGGSQGFSGNQGGFGGTQGFSSSQGGFGGQVPGMRSGGS